ncbi:MAG TPA: EscU/YscU/HrcU family type III secretion system export apparatus switch protein [Acidimicrobiia bacterium]|nr:EscU/YscU/HrcU family type III secretion system export apparatus switch protein [Acidimicrobiia bacterium]
MADNKPAGEKTEKPTPRRIREARERGQVARSADLSTWAGMLATTILLQMTAQRGQSAFRDVLQRMGVAIAHPDLGVASRFAADAAWKAAGVVAPMLIGMLLISVIVNVSQTGGRPTAKKLKPDFSRLNPLKGLKRMVSLASVWEVAKSVAKIGVLVLVSWPAVAHAARTLTGGTQGSMTAIAGITAGTALLVIRNVAGAGLVIAGIDFVVQRRRVMRQLRMTRQELREEMKLQEGNPEVRRAIRSRALAISRNKMIRMVSAADVVVVNPTHYAVALKYESSKGAPEVLAKGAGVIAQSIRSEAEAHGVPIVHEPVLTRTLYRACEVGQLIPVELYEAVAQLLAFVFGLRARGRAQGYHELASVLA